jgi:hypothetical protein
MTEYKKTLVLYTFYKKTKYVDYFIKYAIFKDPNIDFLIIINSKYARITVPEYVKVIYRDNIGYDFGAWSEGLLKNDTYKNYDYFIFANASIIGPFLKPEDTQKWPYTFINGIENNYNIKLFGTTINTLKNPFLSHVQSFVYSLDKEALEYLIKCQIFSTTNYAMEMQEAIWQKEVLMSRKILENGWNIGSLLSYYKDVDFTFKTNDVNEFDSDFFLDDLGFEYYNNKLWTPNHLLFVKNNRDIKYHTPFPIPT